MEKGFFSTAQMRSLGGLVLVMLVVALGSYASVNFAQMQFLNPVPATISVGGEGEVLVVPDIGQFSFSVRAEGVDAAEAQELSGVKINSILSYLEEQGIEEKDIKTQNYNLNQKWKWVESVCNRYEPCAPSDRVPDGFTVSQTVTVKVRDVDSSGKIVSGVGDRGATNIGGLNFIVDDIEVSKVEAREKAIVDAKAKADVLFDQLGVDSVRMVSFYEEGGNVYQPQFIKTMSMDGSESSSGFGGAEMPVGEESMKVRVNITYEIK